MSLRDAYADRNDIGHFGEVPFVRIRFFNGPKESVNIIPPLASDALRHFYSFDLDIEPLEADSADDPDFPVSYEQWLTLETPKARLESEPANDPAFTLHRCMMALNTFLAAHQLIENRIEIREVTTQDLRPSILLGAYTSDAEWRYIGLVAMHPEAMIFANEPRDISDLESLYTNALSEFSSGKPFVNSRLWYTRAMQAGQFRGNAAECVVQLQISMESMLFDLWRMLLVDHGCSSHEIESKTSGQEGFYAIVHTILPSLLGGRWNTTDKLSIVGRYWHKLYLIRNLIVHAGYRPSSAEMSEAITAYDELREYLDERLWARRRPFKRTLLAKLGMQGLERHGWLDTKTRRWVEQLRMEAAPWYLPYDIAGRAANS